MSRKLDSNFMKDLLTGSFRELLQYVKNDNTLDLQIRDNTINIYYLGGNSLKVEKQRKGYKYSFDSKYLKYTSFITAAQLNIWISSNAWNDYFPKVKQAMDFYFTKHIKAEREFQQLVVRENNYSGIANETDYFVIDIEYDNGDNARFDIIAIQWLSHSSERKLQKGFIPKITIFEMKYGDGALGNSSGMVKHCNDYDTFISDSKRIDNFKSEMFGVFIQKMELGLINGISKNSLEKLKGIGFFDTDIDFVFLLANHKPAKTKLLTEVSKLVCSDVKFAISSFMGYGLYEKKIVDKESFIKLLSLVK